MEIWKDINDKYKISTKGRIWSNHLKKCLAPNKNKNGYELHRLNIDGKFKAYSTHRLVAEAFIPNPENKPCIDHIIPVSEGGTNDISNLRWTTHKENMKNERTKKKMSESHKGKALTEEAKKKISQSAKKTQHFSQRKQVYQYTLDGTLVNVYESTQDAAKKSGFTRSCISKCCNGYQNTYKGFIWSYIKLGSCE